MIELITGKFFYLKRKEIWFNTKTDFALVNGRNLFYQSNVIPPICQNKLKSLQKFYTTYIQLDKEQEFLKKKINSTTRYEINKASQEPISVACDSFFDAKVFHKYLTTYKLFSQQKGLGKLSKARMNAFIQSPYFKITYAMYKDEIIVFHTYVKNNNRIRLLTSHHDINFLNHKIIGYANRKLHWEDILAFKNQGFSVYDFGGIQYENPNGITQFKLSFGGEIESSYNFIIDKFW